MGSDELIRIRSQLRCGAFSVPAGLPPISQFSSKIPSTNRLLCNPPLICKYITSALSAEKISSQVLSTRKSSRNFRNLRFFPISITFARDHRLCLFLPSSITEPPLMAAIHVLAYFVWFANIIVTFDLNLWYTTGDVAWILTSTALVWLMIPGVGFFYSGLARRKSALSLIWLSLMSVAIVSFQVFQFYHAV
jgi:Ammonium Transporter Family